MQGRRACHIPKQNERLDDPDFHDVVWILGDVCFRCDGNTDARKNSKQISFHPKSSRELTLLTLNCCFIV